MIKSKCTELHDGVRLLLKKNGYAFSDEDKILLESILKELEELCDDKSDSDEIIKIISLLLQFLKFFGIEDFTKFI